MGLVKRSLGYIILGFLFVGLPVLGLFAGNTLNKFLAAFILCTYLLFGTIYFALWCIDD
jgi:hypothetical protein